jgi:two-component system, cell cycle sensor histidine kinase and response regulator CckA
MSAGIILLVEDNPITRNMLRVNLEIGGYDVMDSPDGKTALELAAARRPDLLILDHVLPDMDGLQLLDEVRVKAGRPEVPAIVLTGMVSRLSELRARSVGSTHVLPKPVEPSQLLEVVHAQLAPAEGRTGGQRILVVDHEPLKLKLSAFRLERAGYEVETASGGEEALEIARHRRPDALLTAVMMPSMDGFTFCREARLDPALGRIPIVLVSSSYVDEADRELARQMGANALVVRTPDLHDALAAIEAGLRAAAGAPPPPTRDDVTALHRERVQVQLERQTARNETLLRQTAIQATALSLMTGLSEVLAQPRDVPQVLGDVLVHSLDAAGLTTGLLYVAEPTGEHRLQAQFGIPADRKADAEGLFGHPQLVRRIVASGKPVALSSAAQDAEARDFLARLGHPSVLVVPVVVLGQTFGELVLASESHDLSESSWIGFARSLALQFGQTVALGQSLKRLATSEGRYGALMEHASDAILILDPTARVVEVNRETERLLGRPRAEIVGRHYDEFVVPDEQADSVRLLAQLLTAGTLHVEERQLVRADGTPLWVEVSASLVRLGEESAVLTILHDITERRRAAEALRRCEARMKSVLVAALDDVIIMDEQVLVVAWNARAAELFGFAPDEAIGRTLAELIIPPRYRADHTRGLKAFLATGEGPVIGRRTELSALRRDGSEFPIELTVTTLKEGGAFYFNAFVADMTERKGVEEEIAERIELTTFTSDIGSALIRDEPLPAVLQQCAEAMMSHLEPAFARIWTLNRAGDTLELQASAGMYTHLDGAHARVPVGQFKIGLIAAERAPHLTNDVVHDPRVSDAAWARREGMVAFAGYPLVVGDELVGVMAMFSRHPLSPNVLGSMAAVANQIALGIKRKWSEEAHQASEEQYRLLFDDNPYPMWVFDVESLAFLAVNDAAVRHYGWTREEFLRLRLTDIRPAETLPAFLPDVEAVREEGGHDRSGLWRHLKKDGTEIDVEIVARSITFEGRRARLTLAADVTEKTLLQARLVTAQKMEAVGQLAGGIAHDFNNLLGVITGYSELLIRELPPESRGRKRGEEIKRAADRAAALTRQLLAFSRRQVLQPKVLDLNEVVAEVEKMLRRVISEGIQIITVATANLGKVSADAGQIEQVLMNLAINARDAMPSGGRLMIETGNVELDETYTRTNPEAHPGPYVMLAVSDTGQGMDAKTMSRIFEPFFTTKEDGKGTGLGLATVDGIVRQSGGTVNVYSEAGRGTTFKVYLPRIEGDMAAEAGAVIVTAPGGTETVLLVEDAEALRLLVRELLENAGYAVLDADTPDKALSMVDSIPGPIHLLLTDMVMPRMNGQELARRIAALKPEARVVFMSGYSDQAMGDLGTLEPGTLFLQKPFTMDALLKTIRRALDAAPPIDGGSTE